MPISYEQNGMHHFKIKEPKHRQYLIHVPKQ